MLDEKNKSLSPLFHSVVNPRSASLTPEVAFGTKTKSSVSQSTKSARRVRTSINCCSYSTRMNRSGAESQRAWMACRHSTTGRGAAP